MKDILSRTIGIALSVSMLFGGTSVLAAAPDDVASATALKVGEEATAEAHGENSDWFSFTPETSGFYKIYTTDYTKGDPYLCLYGSIMNYLDHNDDGGENRNSSLLYYFSAGETYYIEAADYGHNDEAVYTLHIVPGVGGECPEAISSYFLDSTLFSGVTGGDFTFIVSVPEVQGVDYTYTWYKDNTDNVMANTTSSLTTDVIGSFFSCKVTGSDGSIEWMIFYAFRDYDIQWSEPGFYDYMLVDPGEPFTISRTYLSNTENDDDLLLEYNCWDKYELASDRNNVVLFSLNDGILNYTGLNGFAFIDYYLNSDAYDQVNQYCVDEYIGQKYTDYVITAFVMPEEVDGVLESGVTVPVNIENNYDDGDNAADYTFQQIYSFTAPADGTVTIDLTDVAKGVPCVVLFDSEYNQIDNAGGFELFPCYEDIRNPVFIDYAPNYEGVTLTSDVAEGEIYYVAIPIFSAPLVLAEDCRYVYYDGMNEDMYSADYNLTLTFEETEEPVENPTDNPTGTPSTPAPSTPVPSTPTPAIPGNNNASNSEGGVAGFVERLYTIALGRASDPAGKQDWIDAITLRGETGAGAARGFLYSPEFLNKNVTNEEFVATLYRTFFDREPDQAGFNAWVEVLNNGASKEEVIEGFINSTEWANLCLFYGIRNGGTGVPSIEIEPNQGTIDFATRLYTTCLGRNADQAGLMAWARQLANQRDTGTGAAHGFFFSSEFANQNVDNREFVTRLYRTFMNREPDQAGFDAWVAQLDAGVSREEVFNGFAQSIEFARICALYGIVR